MKILHSRSGMTLLETVIVLVIGGMIISGIWVAYSQMTMNEKIRRTVNVIDKTANATLTFLSSYNTVPADLSRMMYNQNLMPSEVVLQTLNPTLAIFYSPLGTSYYVADFAGSQGRMFVIRIGVNVGSNECQRLVPLIIGNMRMINERGIVGYAVGSKNVGQQQATGPLTTADIMSPQEIVQECQGADILRFFYGMRS